MNINELYLKELPLLRCKQELKTLPSGKLLIHCMNAYSYITAKKNAVFAQALGGGDVLLPDGMSIVWSCRLLGMTPRPQERISGWDLFEYEMKVLNIKGGKCFFMGSDARTLTRIKKNASTIYPNILIGTYAPPFKKCFNETDNRNMVGTINNFNPDLLWIGLSAPKQEIWVYQHWNELRINCHVGTVGAVFSFFAGTEKRAPAIWQKSGLEWLYRLQQNPKRLWKRYIIGNAKFMWTVACEFFNTRKC